MSRDADQPAERPAAEETFLQRWARRKHAASRDSAAAREAAPAREIPVREQPLPALGQSPARVQPLAPAPAPAEPSTANNAAPAEPPAPLPPIESLTFDSDFSAFLAPHVPEELKRQALKKLLHDPRFNVMDGLDVYIDDYSTPSPLAPELMPGLAQAQIERYLNRALITQSWKVYHDCWKHELLIPFGRLQIAGASPGPASPVVKYYDINGSQQTLTESGYYWVVTTTDPARIVRKYDATYPELQYGRPDAIEIAFTAGFGSAATAIPDEIKHAMKLLITNYYEHRGDVVISQSVGKIPSYITDLIHSYKLYDF
jgi:uncharacterized phiE125 gp8 family phage protein